MSDKLFFGTILAMVSFFTGHPYIALFIFIVSFE